MKKIGKKIGLPPGSLIYIGEDRTEKVEINIIDYNESKIEEYQLNKITDDLEFANKKTVTWINTCVHDLKIIDNIGSHFKIHPLILEDIVHTGQRPKLESFDDYIYIVLRMFTLSNKTIKDEQVSIILGDSFVITFQEREGDIFNPLRERIRNSKYRIRKSKSDYLCYSILDSIVDNYFVIMELLGDQIEDLEDEVLKLPTPTTLKKIHKLRRRLINLRKSVWPLREIINSLNKSESEIINPSTDIYLRDLYDHTIQIIDTIESFRDMVSGLLDTYLSSVSNRMNEVMKILTIMATIFIPLTFVAGVYGMNFDFMPELKWHYGYFITLGVMLIISIVMILFFKKKKWF